MTSTSQYKEWHNSPFYHKIGVERNEQDEARFIQRITGHLAPAAASRMLDTACGTGANSRLLASLGFSVTGVDMSAADIDIALGDQLENPDLYVHDLRLPFWGNYFDYAFNLFTSFGFYRTRREHDDAIRTIANSLQPGGRLVIDYLNVHFAGEHQVKEETGKIDETIYVIRRWHDDTHFYKKIDITGPAIPIPLSFTERIAKFTLGDFTDMLSFQGMQVHEVFGDYQLNGYDIRKTPRMIIVAGKGSRT